MSTERAVTEKTIRQAIIDERIKMRKALDRVGLQEEYIPAFSGWKMIDEQTLRIETYTRGGEMYKHAFLLAHTLRTIAVFEYRLNKTTNKVIQSIIDRRASLTDAARRTVLKNSRLCLDRLLTSNRHTIEYLTENPYYLYHEQAYKLKPYQWFYFQVPPFLDEYI